MCSNYINCLLIWNTIYHTGYSWKFVKTVNIYSIIKRANVDVTASYYTIESKQQTGRVTGFETLSY